MAATFPIITKRVEAGGVKGNDEVKRIQQLLVRTGHHAVSGVNGIWGKASVAAWVAYQKVKGWRTNDYVDPTDAEDRLACLAEDAGVLMRISNGLRSLSAVTTFTDHCRSIGIPYGWSGHSGGTKMAWGFENRKWAIIFTKPGGRSTAGFDVDSADPRSVNCCSYANLLLSLWSRSDAHGSPYDSGQAVGGDGQQIGERFGMKEVLNKAGAQSFSNLKELKAALKPDRIYHMALCRDADGLFTKHDTIIVNENVYQATPKGDGEGHGAVSMQSLDRQWKRMKVKRARLFGPGPH